MEHSLTHIEIIQGKIFDLHRLEGQLAAWRLKNAKIVFTNGCFDLLHKGHIHLLASAKDLGHRLVVGLNTDASVKRLKGPHRPIQNENDRALIMASMHLVDAVIMFDDDTPINLIKVLKPEVLVKGGDWPLDKIVGADFVQTYGGLVTTVPYIGGNSTTELEEKLKGF